MYPTKVSIANNKGFESITAISRAFEVGTPAEDVVLSKYTLSVRLVQILILLVKLRFPLIWVLLCLILLIRCLLTVLLHNLI